MEGKLQQNYIFLSSPQFSRSVPSRTVPLAPYPSHPSPKAATPLSFALPISSIPCGYADVRRYSRGCAVAITHSAPMEDAQ